MFLPLRAVTPVCGDFLAFHPIWFFPVAILDLLSTFSGILVVDVDVDDCDDGDVGDEFFIF